MLYAYIDNTRKPKDAERPPLRRDAEGPKVMPVVHRDEGETND